MNLLDTLIRDLRHGVRLLLRQPILSFLAVLTLSLGIGANATIFSLLNAALLRPLPFPHADRLIAVVDGFRADGVAGIPPTVPELLDVRRASRTLEALSFYDTRDFQISGGDEPERVFAARVEASFLSVLGARTSYGRLFQDGENIPGRHQVVILGDALWRRNFGGDPGVIGRQIVLNGETATIVGVLVPGFSFDYQSAERIEMYVPFLMSEDYTSRSAPFVNVRRVSAVARLKPGYKVETAAAELQAISQSLAKDHPDIYRRGSDAQDSGFFMTAVSLHETLTGTTHSVVVLLFAAVALVFLIACVNTAQFLLARSMEREAEAAIRIALGASRSRLAAQFMSEAMILGAVGGGLGLIQTLWLTKALVLILPARVPLMLLGPVRVDATVLAFTAAAAFLATIACGLAPALRFGGRAPAPGMAGRGFVPMRARGRQALMAVEVAVSVLLLVVAGLVVQSLREAQKAPSGFSADGVVVMQMRLATSRSLAARTRFIEEVMAIPGVDSVAIADWPIPVGANTQFSMEGAGADAATLSNHLASYHMVSAGYFRTLRIPLREGRVFTIDDDRNRPPVAIVNEEMARKFWPGQSPIGRKVRAGPGPRNAVLTIVGIVENVRGPQQTVAVPQIYVPNLQQEEPNAMLLVRSVNSTPVPADAVKRAIRAAVADQPVFNIRPLSEFVALSFAEQRTVTFLLASFACLALVMSVSGVFAVVSYLTSRRTKEIAIRLAIGAQSRNVLSALAGPAMRWTTVGLVLGLAAARATAASLRGVLPGVTALSPALLVALGLLYLVIVLVAICVPAFKALRVDPGSILRVD